MKFNLSLEARNAIAEALRAKIDASGPGAGLEFYGEPQPQGPDESLNGQVFFGKITFDLPCANVSEGILSFVNMEEESSARASGEVYWARVVDGEGRAIFDCDVTGSRGGGMLEINTTNIAEGGPIRCRSLTIAVPG